MNILVNFGLFDDDETGKCMLSDIVGTRVQNQAYLLSHELLKLMWCAVELEVIILYKVPLSSKANLERMTQIWAETCSVPVMYVAIQVVLSSRTLERNLTGCFMTILTG